MSDPLRTDSSHAPDGASDSGRVAKIEQLLVAGLDHYFAGHYDQAINVWTRALFLDRSHARARAYIERARSALAERQRKSEELLQRGIDAFNRGESDEARRLLHAAVSGGAPSDEALTLLDRIDRLGLRATPAPQPAAPKHRAPVHTTMPPAPSPRSRPVAVWVGVLAAVALGLGAFAVETAPTWRALIADVRGLTLSPPVPPSVEPVLPLPRRSEIALTRAQSLAATGRLRDALGALDLVRATDPEIAVADRLRVEIERQLVGLATSAPTAGPGSASQRR